MLFLFLYITLLKIIKIRGASEIPLMFLSNVPQKGGLSSPKAYGEIVDLVVRVCPRGSLGNGKVFLVPCMAKVHA
jgi:hypothetical protein